MNPVLLIAYNNLDLTKKAVKSILTQDIPVSLTVINNGSNDGTRMWLESVPGIESHHYDQNQSPLKLANIWAKQIFSRGAEYVLAIPNDATFPPNLYSELLKFPYDFVSAGMACTEDPPPAQQAEMLHNDCHFAVILIRKTGYEKVVEAYGSFFDERYTHYASDCDMKQRWRKIGIQGCQTNMQCWHFGSATWRLAPPDEQRKMLQEADQDRETYYRIWGERL